MKTNQERIIETYIRKNEKKREDFKIGSEFEYFVVNKNTLKSVSYYGPDGIESSLKELISKGYEGIYENNHLLGLKKDESTVSLEPGSQVEISLKPSDDINTLEEEYKLICGDLINVFTKKNQALVACGYRIKDKIDDIKIIPKERYHYMYEYFKSCGIYAHNMMKQTSATQVAIDYENEEDFHVKLRILNTLSPIFYAFFDNAPFFEGISYNNYGLRSSIWDNCDDKRCGIIKETIIKKYTYLDYAKYILNQAIIFNDNEFTNDRLFKDLFTNNINELEHAFSMVFPDVRIRKYIEVRMFDSLPYPLNFSVVALIKGIFYDDLNLNELYNFVQNFTLEDVLKAKKELKTDGINTKLKNISAREIMIYLFEMAFKALPQQEKSYLLPLKELIDLHKTPYELTKDNIDWCIVKL